MLQMIVAAFPLLFAQADQPNKPDSPVYKFVQNTERLVGISRGNAMIIGKLDERGDFHQTTKVEARVLPIGDANSPVMIRYSGPGFDWLNGGALKPPRRVYEFRSGMLIPGTMLESGSFVPEEGGKITKFSDYRYSPSAAPIWNLPGAFLKEADAKRLIPRKSE